jgi:hypothetical protein
VFIEKALDDNFGSNSGIPDVIADWIAFGLTMLHLAPPQAIERSYFGLIEDRHDMPLDTLRMSPSPQFSTNKEEKQRRFYIRDNNTFQLEGVSSCQRAKTVNSMS